MQPALIAMLGSVFLAGEQPEIRTIDVGHGITGAPRSVTLEDGRRTVLIPGRTSEDEPVVSLLRPNVDSPDGAIVRLVVPTEMLFFDVADLVDGYSRLLFLSNSHVHAFAAASQEIVPIVAAESVYRQTRNFNFGALDFARDVDGDGRDDLIIPDFSRQRLFVAAEDGFGEPVDFPVVAEMRISQGVPSYQPFPVYSFDVNADQNADLVFLVGRELRAFLRSETGFAPEPTIVPVPPRISGNDWRSAMAAEDRRRDQSDYSETRLLELTDVDGDGAVDLVTRSERAAGVFKRETQYAVHFGYWADGQLAHRAEPDTTMAFDGIEDQHRIIDVNGDGIREVLTSSIDFGFSSIISALFSRSTGLDVGLYSLSDRRFPEDPLIERDLRIDFEFSTGQATIPVLLTADLDGDGLDELIVSHDLDELRIYRGDRTSTFASRATEITVQIPRDGRNVSTADVDGDGREDLLIRYDRLGADGEAQASQLVIITSAESTEL